MTDLLTHVLAMYVLLTPIVWWTPLLDHRHIPVGMAGGILPDLSKLYLVVDADIIQRFVGIPFSWEGLHTIGPVLTLTLVTTLTFTQRERRRVFALLLCGAVVHFTLDAFIIRADGLVPPYLFPFSWWRMPSGDLYLSSTVWPSLIGILCACVVLFYDIR